MKKQWMGMGLAVAMLLVGGAEPASAADNNVGTVADLTGYVTFERNGTPYKLSVGVPLYAKDTVVTGKKGKARILLKDNSVLSIGPRSKVKLTSYELEEDRSFSLDVLVGRFKMDIASWFTGATDGEIQTPSAVAGVRGTVVWGDTELDAVCALEGEVALAPKDAPDAGVDLTGGDCVTGMKEGETNAIQPTPEELKAYLAEVTIP